MNFLTQLINALLAIFAGGPAKTVGPGKPTPQRAPTPAPSQPAPAPTSNFLTTLRAISREPLARADYERLASRIGCEWQALAAVAEVESGVMGAFDQSGRLIILFERHLFSRKTHGAFDHSHPDVSNQIPGGYGQGQDARWGQLARAFALDPEAALESTSWGRFQVLGQNFPNMGFLTARDYVAKLARSERDQLEAFEAFIRANDLGQALRTKNWTHFARRYNGPAFARNAYDVKMGQAYARLVRESAAA